MGEHLRKVIEHENRISLYKPEDLPADNEDTSKKVDWERLTHVETVSTGVSQVYRQVYDMLGFPDVLPRSSFRASHRVLRESVLTRLGKPLSKRASVAYMASNLGLKTSLDSIYRMMDHLDGHRIGKLRHRVGEATRTLVPDPVSVLLFDCTTLYFEAVHSQDDDDLRQFGYSKDGKSNRIQVVLALVVNDDGLPITYELFPGNMYEGKTLEPMISALEAQSGPVRQVLVADAGMLSKSA